MPSHDRLSPPTGILLVDDEAGVLQVLVDGLRHHGFFEVYPAASGQEATDLYRRHGARIALILVDVKMDGPETFQAVQRIEPGVGCWFMTGGDIGDYTEVELLRRGALRMIQKPLGLADLAQALHLFFGGRT